MTARWFRRRVSVPNPSAVPTCYSYAARSPVLGCHGSDTSLYTFLAAFRADLVEAGARLPVRAASVSPAYSLLEKQRIFSMPAGKLGQEQRIWLGHALETVPQAAQVRDLVQRFTALVNRTVDEPTAQLQPWLHLAQGSAIHQPKRFANGIRQDLPAVEAALTLPWSNGQVEGQVNKLKFIKRAMFGRANFALLRKRALLASLH